MRISAKIYIYAVIVAGGALLSLSSGALRVANWSAFLLYMVLAIVASPVKLRLPGLTGTYSLNFLILLFGITRFSLPEVLIAGCAGALAQSVINIKKRPTALQITFNMANLVLSVGACFFLAQALLPQGLDAYRPAMLALIAFAYFLVNTVLVSGVLALLEGKHLAAVCGEWYVWSFPYYLIGAAAVGLLPSPGHVVSGQAWLVLLPLLYLVHFFLGLMSSRPAAAAVERGEALPFRAKMYVFGVQAVGLALVVWAGMHWESANLFRFTAYFLLTLIASTLKVQLPGVRGTISLNFVLLLVAIADLSLPETLAIAALAGIVQCRWTTGRKATLMRTAFNGACLVISVSLAFSVCRGLLASWISQSVIGTLSIATLALFASNTLLVTAALRLVEQKPLAHLARACYFWSFPYYLVGAAAAGLMIETSHTASWQASLLVLPIVALVYVSYRLHVASSSAMTHS